jgi:CheY-like chemotaxis protein
MRSGLTSDQLDHTATALKSARDLMHVLDDVIDVSQLEARHITVDPAPFSAASVVADVVSLFGARADEKSINLSANIDEAIPASLFGDERRLRQVLTNLVGNALKFTDVGEVTVSASYDDATSKLRLEVSDTGIGVPEGTLGKLFRPFFQADSSRTRRHSGSGLGLSISKQLVEMMGGQIGVESVYGQGSTFWCEIEMQASALPVETNANSSAPAAIRPLRILVAEDNVSSQKILGALLGQEGHTLVFANDGTAAVAMAASDTFDVILMDVMMPLMDGITATRRIRGLGGRSSGVPIIALTANALLGDRDRYLAAGMTDYLSKPIDVAALFSAIARAAGQN